MTAGIGSSRHRWPWFEEKPSHVLILGSHRLHIQILCRKHLLLSLLPSPAQPISGGVLSEGSEEVPHKEDRLWSRHEDTLHQRSDGKMSNLELVLYFGQGCFLSLPSCFLCLPKEFPPFSCFSGSSQVYPSIRFTETSLCAPRICCPFLTWTQTPASPFRCPSKKTWTTCRSSHSRLLSFIHQAKVHRGWRPGALICLN